MNLILSRGELTFLQQGTGYVPEHVILKHSKRTEHVAVSMLPVLVTASPQCPNYYFVWSVWGLIAVFIRAQP